MVVELRRKDLCGSYIVFLFYNCFRFEVQFLLQLEFSFNFCEVERCF